MAMKFISGNSFTEHFPDALKKLEDRLLSYKIAELSLLSVVASEKDRKGYVRIIVKNCYGEGVYESSPIKHGSSKNFQSRIISFLNAKGYRVV